jgi:hypothetical protein
MAPQSGIAVHSQSLYNHRGQLYLVLKSNFDRLKRVFENLRDREGYLPLTLAIPREPL